ncbi:MAG: hypothetical protein ABWZ93_16370, partial [Xanthobacteraceae bacterium]
FERRTAAKELELEWMVRVVRSWRPAFAPKAEVRRGSRHFRKVPTNEPASQERAARGAGGADEVTR